MKIVDREDIFSIRAFIFVYLNIILIIFVENKAMYLLPFHFIKMESIKEAEAAFD